MWSTARTKAQRHWGEHGSTVSEIRENAVVSNVRCADIFTLDAHANWDGLSGGNAQGSPYDNP